MINTLSSAFVTMFIRVWFSLQLSRTQRRESSAIASTQHRKPSARGILPTRYYTFGAACWAVLLAGCIGQQTESEKPRLQVTIPAEIRSLRAIDPNALTLSITINDDEAKRFAGQNNNTWSVTLAAPAGQANTAQISWYESFAGQELLLASQSIQFNTGETATEIEVPSSYTTTGGRFDFDLDGISNLLERQQETDPMAADGPLVAPENPTMIPLGADCFQMGSPTTEAERLWFEEPHQICVSAFSIAQHEVTFSQYDLFAKSTQRALPNDHGFGRFDKPVISISHTDAVAYASWLAAQTGRNYRLPTEAEWEYAARAGSTTAFYTGVTIAADQACFDARRPYPGAAAGDAQSTTCDVGSYPANAWGLHDMHGNVSEWTCSEFSSEYQNLEQSCAANTMNRDYEVAIKDGSWRDPASSLRSARRQHDLPTADYYDVGFRLAADP